MMHVELVKCLQCLVALSQSGVHGRTAGEGISGMPRGSCQLLPMVHRGLYKTAFILVVGTDEVIGIDGQQVGVVAVSGGERLVAPDAEAVAVGVEGREPLLKGGPPCHLA